MQYNIQEVEGFDHIISGKRINDSDWRDAVCDFRGLTQAWTTELWFEKDRRKSHRQDVVWKTAICPEKTKTVFSFIGKSAFLPYEYALGNQAKISVNDADALTFHLGLRRSQRWKEGDFELEFIPKRVQTPFEGYLREFELPGCCGIYRLTVPDRIVQAGKSVKLSVRLLPPVIDCITWFMLYGRKDTLKRDAEMLSEELSVMQRDAIRFKVLVDALARKCYPELFPERVKTENVLILHRGHSQTMGWVGVPDILKLNNGDLIVSIRAATEHLSNDGEICTIRSRDSGKTWTDYRIVASDKGVDHRDASILQLGNGRLLMHWFPELSYDKESGATHGDGRRFGYGKQGGNTVHVLHSDDLGESWNRENEIVIDPEPLHYLHSVEPCIELPSGRILMPVYGEIGPRGEEQGAVALFKSDDEGMFWEHFSTVASDQDVGEEGHFSCGETSIRLTKSGKIVAIMRTELRPWEESPVEGLHMWQSVSEDLGETWTKPKRLHNMLSRTQPNLIQLSDGRLLVGYGYRGIDYGQWGDQPFGIRFHVSEDEGETWSPQIILRDDFPNICMGYPASVEIEENRIFTVYWFNLFGRYYLEGSFWTIPDKIEP